MQPWEDTENLLIDPFALKQRAALQRKKVLHNKILDVNANLGDKWGIFKSLPHRKQKQHSVGDFLFLFWLGFVWFWLSPLEHHLLLHCLWGDVSCFFLHSYVSAAAQCFHPFLNVLLQRHHQCPVVSPLEPAASGRGQAPASSHRHHPADPCC